MVVLYIALGALLLAVFFPDRPELSPDRPELSPEDIEAARLRFEAAVAYLDALSSDLLAFVSPIALAVVGFFVIKVAIFLLFRRR